VVPGVSIQSDAGPEEGKGETNDQPSVLGINGIIRVPTELQSYATLMIDHFNPIKYEKSATKVKKRRRKINRSNHP
jgi:hypothetical protein